MNDEKDRRLQRLEPNRNRLPAGFEQLPEKQQSEVLQKIVEQDAELRHRLEEKLGQSRLAEHDMAAVMDKIDELDHERKVYHVKENLETGSGKVDISVRGGDTKFIMPILIGGGIILIVILLVVFGQ